MNNTDATAIGVIIAFFAMVVVISLAIAIAICLMLTSCFNRIPAEHRKMEPAMVWLLLIPCFSLVWNFFVFPRLSESYQSYFAARGRVDVGDCGRGIGMAYAICCACAIIPYLGILAGLAALVVLIVYLVKAFELKGQIV